MRNLSIKKENPEIEEIVLTPKHLEKVEPTKQIPKINEREFIKPLPEPSPPNIPSNSYFPSSTPYIPRISNKTKIILWIILAIIVLLFTIQVVWSNINVSKGKFASNDTIINEVNVQPAEVQVPINVNSTTSVNPTINVENKITLEEGIINKIINETIKGVLNGLNNTNST